MFNLEMLGKVNAAGRKSLILTGSEESTLLQIMRKYCKNISVLADPNYQEQLFKRSDNLPFASKGIPAHTLMCFTLGDPTYHTSYDEIETLDLQNQSILLKGILPGIKAIVSGKGNAVKD